MSARSSAAILTPRYPSQLIEAALEGIVLFCALWALRTLVKVPRGVITGAFFILYALLRIAGEQFRQPGSDSPFAFAFGFLTYGQLLSLFLIFIGIAFLVWGFRTRQYERAFEPQRRRRLITNRVQPQAGTLLRPCQCFDHRKASPPPSEPPILFLPGSSRRR